MDIQAQLHKRKSSWYDVCKHELDLNKKRLIRLQTSRTDDVRPALCFDTIGVIGVHPSGQVIDDRAGWGSGGWFLKETCALGFLCARSSACSAVWHSW
jgi:hypothetical protein